MRKEQRYQWPEMTMGVCYYPEHWDPALWPEDLERMREVGISVIRIAEFAWSKVEPAEGVFDFTFFDTFLDLCVEKGMKVIFGTPTATPPAWLTEKYPEVLNGSRDGVVYRHGGRRHYTYNSPVYQKLCARIVEKEAEHYGPHPAIVGWQIDNELNCETCDFYSEADHTAFREFLKRKYGTLDALNAAWGTVFWNQTYTDWEQVHVLRPVLNEGNNPHQHLDYCRFVADSTQKFCRMQADLIRKYKKPQDFITTNGMFSHIDNHHMMDESLDVYTYDSYPNMAFQLEEEEREDLRDRRWTKKLSEVRSVCPHFGIMEQQSGASGWTTRMESPAPRPGQLTLWAMQSVAQGADFISFFRWRTCTVGTEMYWHGILDYDNRDNRKLEEVRDFYRKLKALDPVCGAENVAAFALLKDYDNVWDAEVDRWHQRVEKVSENAIFEVSERMHTPYDVVYLREETQVEELAAYPVLFYPHPVLMSEARAAVLRAYVEQGGTLVIGCRAGYKDLNGRCVMLPQPGLLQELTGTDVRDFTFVSSAEDSVIAYLGNVPMAVPLFHDVLTALEGTEVLARFSGGYYKGMPVLTRRQRKKGCVLHLGSTFCQDNVMRLFEYLHIKEPFSTWIEAPETVEVVMRRKGEKRFLFVLNFQQEEAVFILCRPATLLYTGEVQEGEITLPPFGTAVYACKSSVEGMS